MVSGTACRPGPDAPSSSPDGLRAVSASPPRPVSLRSPFGFRHVLTTGQRRRVGDLVVVRAVGEPETIRYGLVVGRGIGKAVLRNRAKRRLRQAVLLADLRPGFDYVLIAGESVATVSFGSLVGWLREGARPPADTGTFEAAN